jgi:hypothetical protein
MTRLKPTAYLLVNGSERARLDDFEMEVAVMDVIDSNPGRTLSFQVTDSAEGEGVLRKVEVL